MNLKSFYKYIFIFFVSLFVLTGCGGSSGSGDSIDSDITKPVITLNGANSIELMQGTDYTELGATATDDIDGTVAVAITGTVNINVVGSYTIMYKAKDSAGNEVTVIRTVNVISKTYSLENGNHALMGPLKGATVKVYKLSDLDNAIEEVQTDNLGKFDVTLNGVADTEMLLVAISGGMDVDANDDGVLDDAPTENKGTIHGFAKASELKNGNINITLLSEIVYQYTKHLIGEVHVDDFKQAINTVSSKLLKDSTNKSLRNYQSINNFVPTNEELVQKLDFNYTALLDGDSSISNLYHNDFNITKIETEFAHVFRGKALSFRNLRLLENNTYSKVILEEVIKSNITSTGSNLYVDYDANTSKLIDFIPKGTSVTFTIIPQDEVKILGWEGCDKVSDDLQTCTLSISENFHRIVPNVVYKETKYADNVKDITDYQVSTNDNNYTVSLDLNTSTASKEFINSIVVDDIIISSNPANPFFKKVVSVKKIDDYNYVFTTESTSFLNLYKQGSVFTNRYLTHEDLVAKNSNLNRSLLYKPHNGMRLLPPKHKNDDEFVIVFGEQENSFNQSLGDTSHEIDISIPDGISIKGTISFKLKPEFSYNIDHLLSLESMKFVATKEMNVNLVIEATKEFELNRDICRKLGKADDCNEYWKKRLAEYSFLIPGTPIVLNVKIDASILLDAKIESSIKIGGEYTSVTKTGFNYVNGNLSVIDSTSTNGAMIGEIKPINFTAGEYLKLFPRIWIIEIAGIGLEAKAGLYEECAPISFSTSNLDGDTNFFAGKVDTRISAELKWIWSDWLARFDWAKNLAEKINKKIKDKTGGLNYEYSYNLYEWKSYQVGERPAYLKLIPDIDTRNIKYEDEFIDKHYVYKIKNEGEKKLKWKIEVSDDLKDDLSIFPKNGELEKGDYIDIDMYLQINDLSSKIGKHKVILKFINLSNEEGSNSETGTTTDEISLNVIERIDKPLNLNVELTGESIKQVKYTWSNGATENIHGHKIYMTNYNSQTNSCNNNYINILTTLGNVDKYQVPFDIFENNQGIFKMEAGKKYCFKVSAYKMIFDWLDSSSNESELSEEAILEIPAYGKLQSNITDKNNNPIENARVYLTSITTNTQTDGLGNYTFENLLPGRYKIVVVADGYIRQEAEVTIMAGATKIFERQLVAENDLEGVEGTIVGKVQNALNGSGVNGATIEIRKGINILSGEIVNSITTDNNGNYSTTLETGAYTLSISANGYTSTSATINVFGNESRQKDLSLSPILSEGNMRIVLNWGENPRDLDSHLVKKVNGSEKYHIYYNSHNIYNGQSPTAEGDQLDHDDVTSYGPETVTINNVDTSAVYTYYVHHYAGSSNLKSSSAKVDVYYGSHHFIYSVPNGDGIYWKVFEIVNGEVTPCTSNCIQSSTNSLIRKLDRGSNEFNIFDNLPSKN